MGRKPTKRKKGRSTAMSADNEEKANANGEVRDGANVDKIRDLIFGSQMRDYEKRFTRLEERLAKAADALRDDMKKRFDALESFVGQEMESLGQRLKTEKSERAESLKDLSREIARFLEIARQETLADRGPALDGAGRFAGAHSRAIQDASRRNPQGAERDGIGAGARGRDAANGKDRSGHAGRSFQRVFAAPEG